MHYSVRFQPESRNNTDFFSFSSACRKLRQIDCLSVKKNFLIPRKFSLTEEAAISIGKLTHLEELSLRIEPEDETAFCLMQFSALTNLTKLMIHTRDLNIDGLEDLFKQLSKIQDLDLLGARSQSNNWSILSKMPDIKYLSLVNGAEVLVGLSVLTNLERLVVSNPRLRSGAQFDHVCRLPKLTHLGWGYTERIATSNFRMIANLSTLEALVMNSCGSPAWNGEYNSSPLELIGNSLKNLKILVWEYTLFEMEYPASLTELQNLRVFHATANQATQYDVELLTKLPNLEDLEIKVDGEETSKKLSQMTQLRRLHILGPHIDEVHVHETLAKLKL